jgi:imidazolonepropionase-like amidohydrolase
MVEAPMTRFARAIAVIVVLAVGTLGAAPPPSSRRANDAAAPDRVAIQRLQEEVQIAEILEGLRATPVPALTILRHVRVVDPVDSTVTPGQSIIVSEGQIAWVGASAAEPKVPDATVIDGGDRYASPGLTDMHVHDASASGWLLDLANGVTTVREMGGFPWLLDAREHMKDGRMLGPTLYVAGTIINAFPLEGYAVIVRDAPTARRVVRQLAGCGYDFIKIHNVVPKPAFDAIAEEAARFGMDLVGHVPHGMTNRYAVEHGMRTVEHLKGFLDDRTLEMGDSDYVAVARPSVWVTPTLYAGRGFSPPDSLRAMLAAPALSYTPARLRQAWAASIALPPDDAWRRNANGEALRRRITRALAETPGVQFLAGTDAANYPFQVMGFALIDELQLLEANGLRPLAVLRAATSAPAAAMGAPENFGRIRRGMRADLVLLDGNPLASTAAFRSNAGVMVQGRWLDRATLDHAMAKLAAVYAPVSAPAPLGAAGASALAAHARTLTEHGFVFSAMILGDAAGGLRRAGFTGAAATVSALADAPTTGPCAVPPSSN